VLLAGAVYAWLSGEIELGRFFSGRRLANLRRFLAEDIVPGPLRGEAAGFGDFLAWLRELFLGRGLQATLATLAIAVLAIVLAGLLSGVLAPLAASNLATARPFSREPHRAGGDRASWRALRFATRLVMVVLRAVPEYILAFLLLAVLGPGTAWPAIVALALHNGGILGRLGAETIENLDPSALRSLHAIGAPRRAVFATGVFPQAFGRYLLYFFYRFETCVREASVLGILGIVSLGYWIEEARAKHYYDEMLFFVALGAGIVMVSDLVSAAARRYVRRG